MQNPIYQQELKNKSFDIEEMSNLIYEGKENLEQFKKYQETIANDPILRYDPQMLEISRKDHMKIYCQKTYRYHQLFNLSDNPNNKYQMLVFDDPLQGSNHQTMFIPCLKQLASDEQQKKWLNDVLTLKIIGCYAQTELAHGSDIQNLQTTATFDKQTDEFILNTPSIEATKWWVGELGKIANHTILYAQLIIDGNKYGIQPFMVQIRDLETHLPLDGIELGDIGPKYGYSSKDNGYMILKNVRIPRFNMLSRYARVEQDGKFSPAGDPRIVYATMMFVRAGLIFQSYFFLAAQLVIATRYSTIRQQFKDENGNEQTILDYQTQQEKLIPYIAELYTTCFSFRKTFNMYQTNLEKCQQQDFSMLKDLHALLSGHKAVSTQTTLFGMEKIRQSCGGHGFSTYSGMVERLKVYYPYSTFEGENTIMLLQTARFLIKVAQNQQKITPQCEYLQNYEEFLGNAKCELNSMREFLVLEQLRKLLRFNVCFKVVNATKKLNHSIIQYGINKQEAWDNKNNAYMCEAATSHIHYWMFNGFYEQIVKIHSEKTKNVLSKLCALFALSKIVENPTALYQGNYINGEQMKLIREAREILLQELRFEVLALMEAWQFNDNTLKSAIGSSKGMVYEDLLNLAQNNNPVNFEQNRNEIHRQIESIMGVINPPKLDKQQLEKIIHVYEQLYIFFLLLFVFYEYRQIPGNSLGELFIQTQFRTYTIGKLFRRI
ncbi:hypothetical protein IMG5_158840 [Ichthyophthirius multifiliis]|uniref:Acyl-coenzyme A oxidase n=1 Tax=Ichthyophthirius multifiliis TaxID=5932 RepID=G0QZQ0_ICHMU|nr:hypothetical protein IMG5_158840 [Ichthyophthirius multifiliis]EGR29306.1 hypothetical protein IMG5_158840 [Ichthyophthirius multifiliis]|eukprot:XP_004030542.1 hypothetical protein IMG5_158840 [Ichthyophthirius multifiliis]